MFPYPSGKMHIGHLKNYYINDIYNRFYRISNFKTYFFLGWDSFGTPSENISIKKKNLVIIIIKKNIFYIKNKLIYFKIFINWFKEIFTYKKNFYKLNQTIFLNFVIKNYVYLNNKIINWDLFDKSVLSNEQVLINKGWRSNTKIKKINILTYYFKIKNFKKEIILELNNLDWNLKIKLMQKNWIFSIYKYFCLYFYNINKNIFLIKFSYNLNKKFNLNKNFKINFLFILNLKKNITLKLLNIKIFFSFIDFNFKYYNLNFINNQNLKKIKEKKGVKYQNNIFWELCDWGLSRQRYWGCAIPVFSCFYCKKKYLNFFTKLPKNMIYFKINNFLKKNLFFLRSKCFKCKNFSFKENETLDTFFDSSWYFLKYLKRFQINKFLPINLYIGGIEHSILHLLYSRFIIKFLKYRKIINVNIIFKKLFTQGLIINKTYYFKKNYKNFLLNYKYLKKKIKNFFIIYIFNKFFVYIGRLEKISKSKNNNINLKNYLKIYGKETVKLSILINKPLNENFFINKINVINSYKYIIYFINKINYKKIKIFKIYKINLKIKILNNKLNKIIFILEKNFKKLNYNIVLFYLNKIIKNIKYKNYVFLNKYLIIILKFLFILSPYIIFKILKYFKLNKNFFYKTNFYKTNFFNNKKFILFLNNKKYLLIKLNKIKFLKIKILNLLFLYNIKIKIILMKKDIINLII